MNKVVHIITRLDRGGSAQNTLLTCRELSRRYETILVHGLSLESRMTDQEKKSVDKEIKEAEKRGVTVAEFLNFSILRILDGCKENFLLGLQ